MNTAPPAAILEHWDLIWQIIVILGIFLTIVGGAIWFFARFILNRVWINIDAIHADIKGIIDKIEGFMESHYECQAKLPFLFLDKTDFKQFVNEWHDYTKKRDQQWGEVWNAFNMHGHAETGEVIRRDK